MIINIFKKLSDLGISFKIYVYLANIVASVILIDSNCVNYDISQLDTTSDFI